MVVKQVMNKIHTGILLILAVGTPVVAVIPEQYWFEKRVALAGAAAVALAVWAARTWTKGGIGPIGQIRHIMGWGAFGGGLLVAAVVPAGRIANLMALDLWVGLGAVAAYFAVRSTLTNSKQIKWGFLAVLVGVVAAAATVAGIGRIGPIGPIRGQATTTLEILRRSPIWGEFREFRVARLGILQIASGLGILGILGTLALIYQLGLKSVKEIFKSSSLWWKALNVLVLILLAGFLVLPHPAVMLWPLVIAASLACGISGVTGVRGPARGGQEEGKMGGIRGYIWAILVGMLVLTIAGSSYGLGRVVWGELKFREALAAANQNEGITTYYALLESIQRNPYEVRYRLLASQIDIALANSIAAAGGEQGKPGEPGEATPSAQLTAQDQNNILILIQQAVVESKAAIKLDPENSLLWQNLASIYRGLVGVAGGAEDWALKSYQRAAELNPKDPNPPLFIGEIHFLSGNFQGAADAFLQATEVSPDFARAHYNLAVAYNALGEPDRAIKALERVLEILPEDSEDREQVEKDLTFLKGGLSTPLEVETASPEATPSTELKEATTSAEVEAPPPPVGPEATESAELEEVELEE